MQCLYAWIRVPSLSSTSCIHMNHSTISRATARSGRQSGLSNWKISPARVRVRGMTRTLAWNVRRY